MGEVPSLLIRIVGHIRPVRKVLRRLADRDAYTRLSDAVTWHTLKLL